MHDLLLYWNRIVRTGLRPGEDVASFREVILLNKILAGGTLIMVLYLPLEVYFNGFSLLHLVVMLILLMQVGLVLNRYRKFRLAKYCVFFVGVLFIPIAGLMVGKGVGNNVALIPMVLFGIILFRTTAERIGTLVVILCLYLLLQILYDVYPPPFYLTPEVKVIFTRIFFVISALLTFLLGYYFVNLNGQYEQVIVRQKEAIAERSREITDSISYAKRIQSAILPPLKEITDALPMSFVLYLPKDIVAGDFYWYEDQDPLTMLAVADCTGHGVPGAMVSVVCNNALNRAVREFSLLDPGMILDKTREIVIGEFEKSDEQIRDGMDISLCVIAKDRRSMLWAGANNGLLIVRDGALIEVNADKQPIGDHPSKKPFTTHNVPLQAGDNIYLFSDGFADQFGERTGKKFRMKQFKDTLISLQDVSMADQKPILEKALTDWKGLLEQVDDICVIGFRV
jgi:serine phosphatase RsbU (regulator of sigma subunit)